MVFVSELLKNMAGSEHIFWLFQHKNNNNNTRIWLFPLL